MVAGAKRNDDSGLLLRRRLVLPLPAPAILVTGGAIVGAVVTCLPVLAPGKLDDLGGWVMLGNFVVAERTAEVTALIVLVTTACADLITARSERCAGTSDCAVVTQPAAGFCGLLQLENVCVDFTWQQPQSCGLAPWSGPCAPLVPWLL